MKTEPVNPIISHGAKVQFYGETMLDFFAEGAMVGLLSSGEFIQPGQIGTRSYDIAKLMLAAKEAAEKS